MPFHVVMLCESAQVHHGTLCILGGSYEWVTTKKVGEGVTTFLTIAGTLELPIDQWGKTHDIAVRIVSEHDNVVRQVGGFSILAERDADTFVAGAPLLCPFVRKVPMALEIVGGHVMTLTTEDDETIIRFGVRMSD